MTGAPRFSVLGPVRAWRGDTELDLGSPQQRATLAVLLLKAGHAVPADELVQALWEGDPPTRAVGTLRTYVSRLRRELEFDRSHPELLVSAGDSYVLRADPASIDANVFEERLAAAERARADGDSVTAVALLRAAGELWSGPALSGLPGPFASAQRSRLDERRLGATEARLELSLELGRHAACVGELTALTADHPLRESVRELLMLALYRCGRQAEALGAYAEARRVLSEELGVEPGPELRDLHRRILQADPGLAAPSVPPEAGEARPRPAQLPSDIPDFTGREETLALLRDDLVDGGEVMATVLLSGIGGVGKSALAIHLAHSVRSQFPDGQLYVDLRATSDPAEVLAGFLRALGQAESAIPEAVEERAAQFRSRVADQRLLIVLDDARDAAQLRPLLPGTPSCAVLITSRSWPAGIPLVRHVALDALPLDDALTLLARIAGEARVADEPVAAHQVVTACGFLPLAVRIAASRLAMRPAWRLSRLAERLSRERRRLAELQVGDLAVAASFRIGYDQLDAGTARAFRLLALPDGPGLSPGAAAAVLDLPPDDAEDLLESLTDLGLLQCTRPGHFRYHELLRLFARSLAEEEEGASGRRAALDRLLDSYLADVADLYRVIRPGYPFADLVSSVRETPAFADPLTGVEWIHAERPAIMAAATQALDDPDAPLERVTALTHVLIQMIDLGLGVPELGALAERTATAARGAGFTLGEVRARYTHFWALYETGRSDEARAEMERLIPLCRETGQRVMLAPALAGRALANIDQGRDAEVMSWCDEAIALASGLGNLSSAAFVGSVVGHAHVAMGLFERGLREAEESMAVFQRLGDLVGQVHMVYVRAEALFGLHHLEEALAAYQECLTLLRMLGARERVPSALVRLAQLHMAADRPEEALAMAEEAVHVAEEVGLEANRESALAMLRKLVSARGL
ncbi:BTAD domain-containing putative transcriptional regulator [Spirillospora sp. CA-294931]|uniref:AfsR/SARP family transcriptional regulator n=1 Tax=Spirillospora sp. CA-294931 TaxID=3240042 RepID=UPI003D8C664F